MVEVFDGDAFGKGFEERARDVAVGYAQTIANALEKD